jgi:guanylate kinase
MKHFLFCGPSGSGKTSIVHFLLKQFPFLAFSVSVTTRPKRPNETHGVDYYFLTATEFREKINNNEFLEWEEVYDERYYGTLKSEVERIEKQNKSVIFDVDVEGGLTIKNYFSNNLLSVMVLPPSIDELHHRLKARNTETEESFKKRIEKAEHEMTYHPQFDNIIVNKHLDEACTYAKQLVEKFLSEK